MENPIFIVGSPRSGTGLLRDLLRSHPRITFPPESHFLPLAWKIWGETRGPEDTEILARHLQEYPLVRRWNLTPDQFRRPLVPTFAGAVSSLHESYARKEGKPRWGEKTPEYTLHIPLLSHLYPQAQFIHIVRDGRDVAMSFTAHPSGSANLREGARTWQRFVLAGVRQARQLGPGRYFELRYEKLLQEPEQTMHEVLTWLNEDYCPEVLRATRAPGIKAVSLSETEIVATNREKWRTLEPRDVSSIHWEIGKLLTALGYPDVEAGHPVGWFEHQRALFENKVVRFARSFRPAHLRGRLWAWKLIALSKKRPLF